MINFDLMTHYDTPEAYAAFRRAANADRSKIAQHTAIHLNGIFSVILGREGLREDDITQEDVMKLASCIVTEEGFVVEPDSISETQSALEELAFAVSQAMHPNGKALGITTADAEALILDVAGFYGMEANGEAIAPPPRPNIFKRILNTLFGAFKEDCERYKKWESFHNRYLENDIDQSNYLQNQNLNRELSQRISTIHEQRKELGDKYSQLAKINAPDKTDLYTKLYQMGKEDELSAQEVQEFRDKLVIDDLQTFAMQNEMSEYAADTLQRVQEHILQRVQQISELYVGDIANSLSALEADIKQNTALNRTSSFAETKGKVDLLLDGSTAFTEDAAILHGMSTLSEALKKYGDYADALRPYSVVKQYIEKYDSVKSKTAIREDDYETQSVLAFKAVSAKLLSEYSADKATPDDISYFLELPNTVMEHYVGTKKPEVSAGSSWYSEDEQLRSDFFKAIRSDKLPSTHENALKSAEQELDRRFNRVSKALQKTQMDFKELQHQGGVAPKAPAKQKQSAADLDKTIKENIEKYRKLDTQASRSFFAHIPDAKNKNYFTEINSFFRNVDSEIARTESARVLDGLGDAAVRDGLFTLYLLSEGMTADEIFDTPDELKDKRNALAEQFINDIRIKREAEFAEEKGLDVEHSGSVYDEYCLGREKEIMDMCRTKLAPQLHKMEETLGDIDINDMQMLGDKFRDIQLCDKCARAFYHAVVDTAKVNNDRSLLSEARYADGLRTYNIINDYTEYRNLAFTADRQDAPEFAFYALTARAGAEILMRSKEPDMSDDIEKDLEGLKRVCARGLSESDKLERATGKIKFEELFAGMKKALSDNKEAVAFRQFYSAGTFDPAAMKQIYRSSEKSM